MIEITANNIKTKGISVLDAILGNEDNAVITVKGDSRYVVIPIEKYNKFSEFEIALALNEIKKDIGEGKYYFGIDEHLKKLSDV